MLIDIDFIYIFLIIDAVKVIYDNITKNSVLDTVGEYLKAARKIITLLEAHKKNNQHAKYLVVHHLQTLFKKMQENLCYLCGRVKDKKPGKKCPIC